MMEKLLTVVIPVYQVEAYIRKCLDSLVIDSDLMSRMDVLIVNDGTLDRSAEISREYVARFPGVFRQIDKANGGHGSVWNLGVQEADGKYVKFLDSDDWLENLDIVLRKLEQTEADLVITSCICHCPSDKLWKLEIKDMEFDKVYDADRFDWLGNRSHGNYVLHHCAVYRTEMLRQYLPLFLENQHYDDMILGAASIIGAKTLVAWDLEVYQYLMGRNGQSSSREVQRQNAAAKLKEYQSIIGFIEKHPISDPASTKRQYFKEKLPKLYGFGYRTTLLDSCSYRAAKQYSETWDSWVRQRNPNMTSRWIRLYRQCPFFLYWCWYKCYAKGIKLYQRVA